MTISEAINRTDALTPNGYAEITKVQWLSDVEWDIKRNIIDTHENPIEFDGYDENTNMQTTLIAPAPFDALYLYWLESKIHYANGEIGKFNNAIAVYNVEIQAFRDYYNRTHKPLQKNKIKCF